MRDLAPIALCIPPPKSKKYYAEATTSSITTSFDFKIELLILLSFTIVHNYYANVLLMVLRMIRYEMLSSWQKLIDKTKFGNLYFFRYCLLTMLNNNLYKSLNIEIDVLISFIFREIFIIPIIVIYLNVINQGNSKSLSSHKIKLKINNNSSYRKAPEQNHYLMIFQRLNKIVDLIIMINRVCKDCVNRGCLSAYLKSP